METGEFNEKTENGHVSEGGEMSKVCIFIDWIWISGEGIDVILRIYREII